MDQELLERYARAAADAAVGLVFHCAYTEGCYNSFIVTRYINICSDKFWETAYSRMQAIIGITLESPVVNDILPIAQDRLSSVRADVSHGTLDRIRQYAESIDMLVAMERVIEHGPSMKLIPKTHGALRDAMNHVRKQCRERGEYGYAPLKFEVPVQW